MSDTNMIRNFEGDKYKHKQKVDVNLPNNSLSIMFSHITDGATVLDVGCACGDFGSIIKEMKHAEVYGLEYNKESVELALKTGAYKEVTPFDLDLINSESLPEYRSKFDFIVCGDVLEHLRNPKYTLEMLKTYLKPNGFIIASIPNIAHMSIKANLLLNDFTYTPTGLLDETHIHFFTYRSIAEMIGTINLKIEECDFTMFDRIGMQRTNPYPFLSNEIQKFLYKDYHSYVCQYVVKMSDSKESKESLLQNNLDKLNINEWTAPFYILNYRKQLLEELFISDL